MIDTKVTVNINNDYYKTLDLFNHQTTENIPSCIFIPVRWTPKSWTKYFWGQVQNDHVNMMWNWSATHFFASAPLLDCVCSHIQTLLSLSHLYFILFSCSVFILASLGSYRVNLGPWVLYFVPYHVEMCVAFFFFFSLPPQKVPSSCLLVIPQKTKKMIFFNSSNNHVTLLCNLLDSR